MKLNFPSFPKLPSYRPKRSGTPRPPRALRASAAKASQQSSDDYHEDEPTTSLTSAFIVVLLLHVVAVGGIYAFNSIKAHRRADESVATAMEKASAKTTPAPEATPDAPSAPAPRAQTSAASPAPSAHTYHARPGDTMAKIAAANGISAQQLADANGLKESTPLHVGQSLTIPTAKAAAVDQRKQDFLALKATTPRPAAANGKTYTVVRGDNPVAIARKLHISSESLMKLNGIDDPSKLQIGQVLKVPVKGGGAGSTGQ